MMKSYGRNTGEVKRKIKQGGKMAGGSRRGPSAPNMRKGNKYQSKRGM